MTTIIDGSAGITFPNSTVQASAGQVLQVVNSQTSISQVSTSSASYVTTGISASITPKFSNSKIFVIFNSTAFITTGNGNFTVYRNSTNLETSTGGFNLIAGTSAYTNISINLLDSPATTSSTTYTMYFKVASGSIYTGLTSYTNTITLMEIAG
jgi:hypothetical protein